jgi:uncharacterized protein with HEPN domain
MRDDGARILDILETCDQIIQHIGTDHERFRSDPVIQAAAQRWLEIIGEATTRLSDHYKAEHPDIVWRELIGMRNILAHGYFHVDHDIVWTAVTRDVPQLRADLTRTTKG